MEQEIISYEMWHFNNKDIIQISIIRAYTKSFWLKYVTNLLERLFLEAVVHLLTTV